MKSSYQKRSLNKTNPNQKKIMVDFMLQHPELARSHIRSGSQGKKKAQRLWAALTAKLNAAGPPIKDVKLWRKAYSDQKYHIKKKITSRKGSSNVDRTSFKDVEHQIIQAAGFNNSSDDEMPMNAEEHHNIDDDYYHHERFDIIEIKEELEEDDEYQNKDEDELVEDNVHNRICNRNNTDYDESGDGVKDHTAVVGMVAQLNQQFQNFADDQKMASAKLDRLIKMNENLIKMKERSLKMKEEQHAMDMALKRMDLEIKTLELKALKTKSVLNVFNML